LGKKLKETLLTNQILLFHSETAATPWLQTTTGAVLGLQIEQAVNYEY